MVAAPPKDPDDLPLLVRDDAPDGPAMARPSALRRALAFLPRLLIVPTLLFAGGVLGLYFQPPGVRAFFGAFHLEPGAGSTAPIALPPEVDLPQDVMATLIETDVVGLARLMPRGDVALVAVPYGAGDARVAKLNVAEGDQVTAGQIVAELDNRTLLSAAQQVAAANVAVAEASLAQTREGVHNSQDEARATLQQAKAAAQNAKDEYDRLQALFTRSVVSKATLDAAESTSLQADRAVEKAAATLARYASVDIDAQPDVIVALRNLDAAKAELARANANMSQSEVRASISGVVLEVSANPGERPSSGVILRLGDTSQMMAEAEIYQDRVSAVELGQPVELLAEAIGATLYGEISRIGLLVGRQELLSDDTAANTDARVVQVLVTLDADSSQIAQRYTDLEVVARIDTRSGGSK